MRDDAQVTADARLVAVSCHGGGGGQGGGKGAIPKSPKTFAPSVYTLRESLAMPL